MFVNLAMEADLLKSILTYTLQPINHHDEFVIYLNQYKLMNIPN